MLLAQAVLLFSSLSRNVDADSQRVRFCASILYRTAPTIGRIVALSPKRSSDPCIQ
jgi:hypothetical protein